MESLYFPAGKWHAANSCCKRFWLVISVISRSSAGTGAQVAIRRQRGRGGVFRRHARRRRGRHWRWSRPADRARMARQPRLRRARLPSSGRLGVEPVQGEKGTLYRPDVKIEYDMQGSSTPRPAISTSITRFSRRKRKLGQRLNASPTARPALAGTIRMIPARRCSSAAPGGGSGRRCSSRALSLPSAVADASRRC